MENALILSHVIKNVPLLVIKEIMGDQKDMDESSSSTESLNTILDSNSTMPNRELLNERQENKTQMKVFNNIKMVSFFDNSSY